MHFNFKKEEERMKNAVVKGLALAMAAGMVFSTAACAEDGYKDTLVWAQGSDVSSLDPHNGKDTPSVEVSEQIFDTLFVVNPETNEVEGQICESWEQTSDTSYVFKIKEGIKFHDGVEMTAEDVKFSLDRAANSASVSYVADFMDVVTVIDDYTVEVTLDAPYAPALRNLSVPFTAIVPKHIVETDEENWVLNPVGSGPYKFVEWNQGDSIKLEAFDEYFAGAPATKNLVMKVIPEAAQRTIALETGEIDIAYSILVNDLDRVKENEDLTLYEAPSLSCQYISFNMNRAPFDNQLVRQAINYAIDRELIVETICCGSGQAADAIIAPAVFGYSDPGDYEYNPDKARELLAEAGYADGFDTVLTVSESQTSVEACQAIQFMLMDIGINCEIEIMEFGSFIEQTSAGEFDMGYFGWVTSTKDADYTYYSLEHSSQQGAPGNRSFVNDEKVDALVETGRTTTDEAERLAAYEELSAYLFDLCNNAPIYYSNITAGTNAKVEGFVMDPIGYHDLSTVKVAE